MNGPDQLHSFLVFVIEVLDILENLLEAARLEGDDRASGVE